MPLNFTVDRHAVLDSTNLEAMRQARAGAAEGLTVIAGSQTAGRGRHGRSWQSPPGNLFLSLVLRPDIAPARAGELAFVSALAAADTIDGAIGQGRAALKWPNDVLVDNAKICGILIESEIIPLPNGRGRETYGEAVSRTGEGAFAGGARAPSPAILSHSAKDSASPVRERDSIVDFSIVGIGINIASAPGDTPYPATCLQMQGANCTRDQIADSLLTAFATRHEQWLQQGFPAIRSAWLAQAWNLGAAVVIDADSANLTGQFDGIDADGALLLGTQTGTRRIVSGSLSYRQSA